MRSPKLSITSGNTMSSVIKSTYQKVVTTSVEILRLICIVVGGGGGGGSGLVTSSQGGLNVLSDCK